MRSDQVFVASRHVENRFLLCHLVRVSSRKFHRAGIPIQDTISKVLGLVDVHSYSDDGVQVGQEWISAFSSASAAEGSDKHSPKSVAGPALAKTLEVA